MATEPKDTAERATNQSRFEPQGQHQPETYEHRTPAVQRPAGGVQQELPDRRQPKTYRYDSSLAPELSWDENAERDLAECLARLKSLTRPFLNWAGKAERQQLRVSTIPLFVHERHSTRARRSAAWSILNRVAEPTDDRFSDTVLVVCPNVTIRERLKELDPALGDLSLYRTRQLVPGNRMEDLRRGEVMIANWHRLAKKESNSVNGDSTRVGKTGEVTEVVKNAGKSN